VTAPDKPKDPHKIIADCERQEATLRQKLVGQVGKANYLRHLMETQKNQAGDESDHHCVICRGEVEDGYLTDCGHLYCQGTFS
jgi:E3 ubiquitin-protein ligase SHPRH